MRLDVNGTRLWFDVLGPALEPDGPRMRERPRVILLHGGPGGYDHSYFRPSFDWLAEIAQVVLLDLREHGRSDSGREREWTLDLCAEDIWAFCQALAIEAPIVIGHSMGGMVALLYAARHPGQLSGLVVLGGMARYDVARITDGFRAVAGDQVAEIAQREYGGESTPTEEWARARLAFGPHILSDNERSRLAGGGDLAEVGMRELASFDVVRELQRVDLPTLVVVGSLDPVTPVAAAVEIVTALPPGMGRLEVIDGAGHWVWLDAPDRLRDVVGAFVGEVGARPAVAQW